jgi:hypothetical protein
VFQTITTSHDRNKTSRSQATLYFPEGERLNHYIGSPKMAGVRKRVDWASSVEQILHPWWSRLPLSPLLTPVSRQPFPFVSLQGFSHVLARSGNWEPQLFICHWPHSILSLPSFSFLWTFRSLWNNFYTGQGSKRPCIKLKNWFMNRWNHIRPHYDSTIKCHFLLIPWAVTQELKCSVWPCRCIY